MIDHILVPLDGSALAESVLPHLFAFARPFHSHVTLLSVVGRAHADHPDQRIDPLDWQMRRAEARSYLNKVKNKLSQAGLSVKYELQYGDPATRIVEFVQNHDIDLLLLSSHGQSGLTGWNISSVVQKIVIRVQTPIVIVRAYRPDQTVQAEAHYKKLLIPLDGSSRAEIVLPLVAELGEFHKAQIILAHVIQEPELPRRAPRSQEENKLVDDFLDKNKQEAARYLDGLKGQFPVDMQIELIVGEQVVDALHTIVEQDKPDLVVMSAHGYTGSEKRPFGGLALNFIVYGTNPLLIVQDIPESCEKLPAPVEIAYKENPGH
jgi:nucleotide-binding universal stress UspA family protein